MSEPEEIDIHTTAGKLADLQRRIDEATHAGSARVMLIRAGLNPAGVEGIRPPGAPSRMAA